MLILLAWGATWAMLNPSLHESAIQSKLVHTWLGLGLGLEYEGRVEWIQARLWFRPKVHGIVLPHLDTSKLAIIFHVQNMCPWLPAMSLASPCRPLPTFVCLLGMIGTPNLWPLDSDSWASGICRFEKIIKIPLGLLYHHTWQLFLSFPIVRRFLIFWEMKRCPVSIAFIVPRTNHHLHSPQNYSHFLPKKNKKKLILTAKPCLNQCCVMYKLKHFLCNQIKLNRPRKEFFCPLKTVFVIQKSGQDLKAGFQYIWIFDLVGLGRGLTKVSIRLGSSLA